MDMPHSQSNDRVRPPDPAPCFGCAAAAAAHGRGAGDLPVGLQVLGNYFSEGRLLHAAHALQQATDWHLRKPEGF